MVWDKTYDTGKKVWGEKPGEVALFAGNFLKQSRQFRDNADIFILNLGCGYGQDSILLAKELPCHILSVDSSQEAINAARESLTGELKNKIEFLCYDFSRVADKYDVVLCSSLYSNMKPDEREALRNIARQCLQSNGLFFLSALSVHDIQHKKRGLTAEGEKSSFVEEHCSHLYTREELEQDFNFLNISALFERHFIERRSTRDYHHVIWILMGNSL
ncbi:MAG: class I SAM-dependent methyltransferase [Dehalococcoidales bacterium]|nr:class I SAM-dependent methyltransferase [Dehalococcoidales bacterium]